MNERSLALPENQDAEPVDRQKSALDRARESWHSDQCPVPGCPDLKRPSRDWFCLRHYRLLPRDVMEGLGRKHFIISWLQAMAIFKEKI